MISSKVFQRYILWNIEKYFIDSVLSFQIIEGLKIKNVNILHIIPNPLKPNKKTSLKNTSSWAYFLFFTVQDIHTIIEENL